MVQARLTRRDLIAAAITSGSIMLADPARSQLQGSWPQRGVKLIVPLGPGSGADIGARQLAQRLQQIWGKSVIVENRPGGNGLVATTGFLSAQDDHTLMYAGAGTFTAHPYQMSTLPYDFKRDLLPIAQTTNTVTVVAVPSNAGPATMREMVDWIRSNPGKLNAAVTAGLTEITFDGFVATERLQITKVPYRNIVEAVTDLGLGRIHVMATAYATVQPGVEGGAVRLVAVTGRQRFSGLPDLGTCEEQGFPSMAQDGLVGLFGPKMMPMELRERVAQDVLQAMKDPAIVARLRATGQEINPGNAKFFESSIQTQMDHVAQTARVLGLRAAL